MGDYVALQKIQAPGTLVMAYNVGDPVLADVVSDWGLTEDQVEMVDGYEAPRPDEGSDDRAQWEAYVVGQGTALDEARAASLDELKAMYEAPPEPETPAWQINDARETQERVEAAASPATPAGSGGTAEPVSDRPADSANKADWITYVVEHGGDSDWANSGSTTKSDLQAWKG